MEAEAGLARGRCGGAARGRCTRRGGRRAARAARGAMDPWESRFTTRSTGAVVEEGLAPGVTLRRAGGWSASRGSSRGARVATRSADAWPARGPCGDPPAGCAWPWRARIGFCPGSRCDRGPDQSVRATRGAATDHGLRSVKLTGILGDPRRAVATREPMTRCCLAFVAEAPVCVTPVPMRCATISNERTKRCCRVADRRRSA